MAWSNLTTITNGAVLTATELNKYKDNLNYLRSPRQVGDTYIADKNNTTWSATFTSTSWANISTDLNLVVTNVGEPILYSLLLTNRVATAGVTLFLDLEVDGARIGHSTDGLWKTEYYNNGIGVVYKNLTLSRLLFLSGATHNIKTFGKLSGAGSVDILIAYAWARML